MRRIIFAIGATLSGIVLLFSWPTSTNQPVASAGGTTGGSTGSGGSAVGTGGTTSGAVTTGT